MTHYTLTRSCQNGQKDPEVSNFVGEKAGEGGREDEQNWNNCVDHCGLLNRHAQRLHVQIYIGISSKRIETRPPEIGGFLC